MISGAYPPVAFVSPYAGAGSGEPPAPAERARSENAVQAGNDRPEPARSDNDQGKTAAAKGQLLDEAQLKELTELKARDREVRAHETAHQAVGGQYAGAISYVYQRGPDGAQYAVGGEVSIDIAPVQGDPQATIEKMRVVRAAAMAPAEPSAQDRAVAAQAMQTMLQAQADVSRELAAPDGEDRPGAFRQASDAYESVSRMGEPEATRAPSITA